MKKVVTLMAKAEEVKRVAARIKMTR